MDREREREYDFMAFYDVMNHCTTPAPWAMWYRVSDYTTDTAYENEIGA